MFMPADFDQALSELIATDPDWLGDVAHEETLRDARKFPRFPFRGRAQAVIFPVPGCGPTEPKECQLLTTDLSRSGVSLLHRKPLYAGQQILLVLNAMNRLVEVCWCCRVWAGLYAAGCQFVDAAAHEGMGD